MQPNLILNWRVSVFRSVFQFLSFLCLVNRRSAAQVLMLVKIHLDREKLVYRPTCCGRGCRVAQKFWELSSGLFCCFLYLGKPRPPPPKPPNSFLPKITLLYICLVHTWNDLKNFFSFFFLGGWSGSFPLYLVSEWDFFFTNQQYQSCSNLRTGKQSLCGKEFHIRVMLQVRSLPKVSNVIVGLTSPIFHSSERKRYDFLPLEMKYVQ